jgi:UDP-hydrolysing UDP-N-acetyl-D-glucosamine 2-epimerase
MRKIAVITTSRADFGLYRPVLDRLRARDDVELLLLVGGTHLEPKFGETVTEIRAAGFEPAAEIRSLTEDDAPVDIGQSMGRTTEAFAPVFELLQPDIAVVLGDRFEMHAAALAAVPFRIPLLHIHGGETTAGAIDDVFRHSLTKLSHLHCVAAEEFGRRVMAMGEEPWRVHVCGAPGLDTIREMALLDREAIATRGLHLPDEFLVVTMHPVTLEFEQTEDHVANLLGALDDAGLPVVATRANADTHGRVVNAAMESHAAAHGDFQLVDNLGSELYLSVLSHASAMVGNSSSGIIEAPMFGLPVVNVGSRQEGRPRATNVLDVPAERDAIAAAIRRALSPEFRQRAAEVENPYGNGNAADRIVEVLTTVELDEHLLRKRFHEFRAQS